MKEGNKKSNLSAFFWVRFFRPIIKNKKSEEAINKKAKKKQKNSNFQRNEKAGKKRNPKTPFQGFVSYCI